MLFHRKKEIVKQYSRVINKISNHQKYILPQTIFHFSDFQTLEETPG